MKAVDSSVVIAAFATWHEHHRRPQGHGQPATPDRPRGDRVLLGADPASPAAPRPPVDRPCLHHRAVHRTILTLSETGYQELLATITAGQILGGPAYDALIAFTAVEHQVTLLSLDSEPPNIRKPPAPRLNSLLRDGPRLRVCWWECGIRVHRTA